MLQSPMGTLSTLLPYRRRDYHSDGFHEWPFMTVHSWGENPTGNWKLIVKVGSPGTEASLEKLTLVLLGTKETPRSVRNVPESCHPECKGKCAGSGAQFCDTCKTFQLIETFECVPSCPIGTYEDHHMCRPCPPLCAQCNKDRCITCMEDAVRVSDDGCSSSCERFSFLAKNGSCLPCHHSCVECTGPDDTSCTACSPQFTPKDGRCSVVTSCQSGEYFNRRSMECRACHKSCAECVGKGVQECTACYPGSGLEEGACSVEVSDSKECTRGHYYDGLEEKCLPCSSNCARCSDDATCLSCDSAFFLWTERIGESQLEVTTCVADCPKGFHGDAVSLSCQSCPSYCVECETHDHCTSCTLDFAKPFKGQCPQPCHDSEFFDFSTSHCLKCLPNCLTCRNAKTCLACQTSSYLISDTSCVEVCPEHLVEDKQNHKCISESCHESCETCFGKEPDECLSCPGSGRLLEHACVEECPHHTYYDEAEGSCRHCHASCLSCAGQNEDNCLRCPDKNFLSHFTCVSECPHGSFVLNNTECVSCPTDCLECSSTEKCSTCKDGFLTEAGRCVKTCDSGFVADDSVCQPCATGCSECSQPHVCTACNQHLFHYKPDHSCLENCPAGYYSHERTCSECPTNCSLCTGPHKSQCLLCSQGSAMDQASHTCTLCCNRDFPDRAPCCDCDADNSDCVLQSTPPPIETDGHTKTRSDTSHGVGLAITIIIILLVAASMLGIGMYYAVTRWRRGSGMLYSRLPNPKNGDLAATLALVEDSESGSEAELFAKADA